MNEKKGLTDEELADLESSRYLVLLINEDCWGRFFHRKYLGANGFLHARKYREEDGWIISDT